MTGKRKKRSTPSHLVDRGGMTYVRLPYPDGSGRKKERRLREGDDPHEVIVRLKAEMAAELQVAQSPKKTVRTVGTLLDYYVANYKPLPAWYEKPIRETVIRYEDLQGALVEARFSDLPLELFVSDIGYELLLAFKRARQEVKKRAVTRVPISSLLAGRASAARLAW